MTRPSTARTTLTKARFFLAQAEQVGPSQREAFEAYLEAAIVFGRSVTFHIQKEYAHRPEFRPWYSHCQEMMGSDRMFGFFQGTRNFILKEGPAETRQVTTLSASLSACVVAGEPSAPPTVPPDVKIVPEDPDSRVTRTYNLHFDDPAWIDKPALEQLRKYLDKLEIIVNEAEAQYCGPG